ncbi:MAG: hypothetical protein GF411_20305 [Candidatus Lokiarchaeota archaeon]|nr:hypothetical protein [Candidatus Lokiarchaeota archaeon]
MKMRKHNPSVRGWIAFGKRVEKMAEKREAQQKKRLGDIIYSVDIIRSMIDRYCWYQIELEFPRNRSFVIKNTENSAMIGRIPTKVIFHLGTSRGMLNLLVSIYDRDKHSRNRNWLARPVTMIQIGSDDELYHYQSLNTDLGIVVGVVAPVDNTLPAENRWSEKERLAWYG